MAADVFNRLSIAPPPTPTPTLDAAFAARTRLQQLRDALTRAAKRLRSRWNEPEVFFFDKKRQAELEAARSTSVAPPDRFAEVASLIAAEMPALLATVNVRRVARALGLKDAARKLALHCSAANDLAELLAIPDDEVFLAIAPASHTGLRLHVRGAASVVQLHKLLTPGIPVSEWQLFTPAALQSDGTLPAGFAGSKHWLWPTQSLTAIPRVNGERVVLLGPATIRASLETPARFPELAVESEVIETLNAIQVAEFLSRLCGNPIAVSAPDDIRTISRAA